MIQKLKIQSTGCITDYTKRFLFSKNCIQFLGWFKTCKVQSTISIYRVSQKSEISFQIFIQFFSKVEGSMYNFNLQCVNNKKCTLRSTWLLEQEKKILRLFDANLEVCVNMFVLRFVFEQNTLWHFEFPVTQWTNFWLTKTDVLVCAPFMQEKNRDSLR